MKLRWLAILLACVFTAYADLAPKAPTDLHAGLPPGTVTIFSLSVDLHWQDNAKNETGYRVERAPADWQGKITGAWVKVADLSADSESWSDPSPIYSAVYRVVAVGKHGEAESNTAAYRMPWIE